MHRDNMLKLLFPLSGDGIINAKGKDHAFQKKLLGKVFSNLQLKHYIPVFNNHAENLCKVSLKFFSHPAKST